MLFRSFIRTCKISEDLSALSEMPLQSIHRYLFDICDGNRRFNHYCTTKALVEPTWRDEFFTKWVLKRRSKSI